VGGRTQVPGAGVGRGGGPPGRGAPPRGRRKGRRRRRQLEELEPQELPTYTAVDAPVPEGQVIVERGSTAQEMAPKLNRSAADVVRFLLTQGEMVTATQSLSDDMIDLFATEIGADVRLVDPGAEQEQELQKLLDIEFDDEDAEPRPPVVTVMGHVDHGKTLLLDRIRASNVAEGEAGGITQHIGAYQVDRDGHRITFIDTPGHEAFTAMRARGAEATDIVILVVAADDGVMPQTVEAINHARVADVPIVVAINKIDRDNADPQRVLAQLAEHQLIPEAYGGDIITVEVSALNDLGIDDLLDQVLLVAELEELSAPPTGRAMGVVLESHLDKGRGPVATALVQQGTLEVGDPVVAGAAWGRVRAMLDDRGQPVRSAGPSMPVEVLGLSEVARAGDEFVVAPDEKSASKVAETREHWQRQASMADTAAMASGGAKLEDIFKQIQAGEAATLNLILKADVHGSLEAVTASLRRLETDAVRLSFVDRGVGGITQSDVELAMVSNATIIGFGVRPDRKARELAEAEGVEVRLYELIYELLEDTERAMLGQLAPEFEEIVTGDAEVREIFAIPRVGRIAGCLVQNGTITRGAKVRFLREGVIIWKGTITSLKRFKEDVREVQAGFECGIGLSDFQDLKPGDIIETYEEREIEPSLT
jgi:translation initiation factor IF-2